MPERKDEVRWTVQQVWRSPEPIEIDWHRMTGFAVIAAAALIELVLILLIILHFQGKL
ncbi:hypothetical protein ACPVPU_07445 [Sphingomonas sp. CJ99]